MHMGLAQHHSNLFPSFQKSWEGFVDVVARFICSMCVSVLLKCMSVHHHMGAWCPWKSGEQAPWNWSFWQLWEVCECWELNPGPLQEQVFLTAEPLAPQMSSFDNVVIKSPAIPD